MARCISSPTRVVVRGFLKNPWPDEIVLTPAKGSKKYHEDLAGIEVLRAIGVAQ